MVWTALLPTRPGITTPWLQPNISLNLQPIKFVRKSSSQGISQSWCQGESFPVNACVTDVLDLKQMCHTAVMCCEISIKYIVRHVKELHSPANDPYVVTQPSVPWMPLARSCNYKLFIVPFLFWTNFLLVIVNFIKTAHDIFNLEQYFKNRQPCHYLFFFFTTSLSFCPSSILKELCSSFKVTVILGDTLQFQQGRSSTSISTLELAQQVTNLLSIYLPLSHMVFCQPPRSCWLEWKNLWASCLGSSLASCVCIMW